MDKRYEAEKHSDGNATSNRNADGTFQSGQNDQDGSREEIKAGAAGEQRTYLMGKRYEARKHTQGGDRRSEDFSTAQNAHLKSKEEIKAGTAGKIGKDYGMDGKTVRPRH